MRTVLLLICSNVFMTTAWYGHLKHRDWSMGKAIIISWLIAFFEYMLQVPANRWGYGEFTASQLKIIQEVITLSVFIVFCVTYLKEPIRWNYVVSFLLVIAAVAVAMLRPA
jgi:uncharacterized protein (DUF486 family)